jgi:protoporphyrinogen oxidase
VKCFIWIALVCVSLVGCSKTETAMTTETPITEATDSKYKAGQVWSYKTRPQEPNSTLTVVKVESGGKLGTIVHISLQGLKVKNARQKDGFSDTISHLPFSEKAIDQSVVELVKADATLPAYEDGYKQWKQAFDAGKGGIFTITVKEAVEGIEKPLK